MALEYTEMSNAIVVICFNLLHIARTWWGLWQLRMFRMWAQNSINNLRNLGITPTLSEKDSNYTAKELSYNLLVNETVIDNQLIHGLVRFRPHRRNLKPLRWQSLKPELELIKPIHVCIRWSTAIVSQLMTDWVADFRAVPDPVDECTTMNSKNNNAHTHSQKSVT